MSLEELGKQAYQKANLLNDFKGAVEILNRAIVKYPNDRRLYNNRSYCYHKLKNYDKALEDANFMVKKFPDYIKSHYRKGEALFSMNNLLEAEKCFKTVLRMEPNNEEAESQLIEIQTKQLCFGKDYSKIQVEKAIKLSFYDLKTAFYLLENGGVEPKINDDIYYSDEEVTDRHIKVIPVKPTKNKIIDPFTDPSNVFNCPSIWVGNISKSFDEDSLKKIFSEYGKIKSLAIQHHNFCAFINFMDASMASKAVKLFPLESHKNYNFIVKFPTNAAKSCPKINFTKS